MPKFFIPKDRFEGEYVTIDGENANHIARSLRMRTGERVTLSDGERNEYECELVSFTPDTVTAKILSISESEAEPPYRAALYQCVPKGDKMEYIVQKAVELGVFAIVPVLSRNCVSRPDEKDFAKKIVRWQKIADQAACQSGRGILPQILPPMRFDEAVESAAQADLPLFCYEAGGTRALSAIFDGKNNVGSASIFIGPEGGFDPSEAQKAEEKGMLMTGLGKRILRTETASGYVLCALSARFELPAL